MKSLFSQEVRAGLVSISMKEVNTAVDEKNVPKIEYKDSIRFIRNDNYLRVECTRHVFFEPECLFDISVTYFIEHYLNEAHSLDAIQDTEIMKAIKGDLDYYTQQGQGHMSRISLIIGEITSSFGGSPALFPPYISNDDVL